MSDDLEPVAVSLHGGQRLDNGHRLVGMCWADSDTLTLFGVQKPPEYRPEAVPIGDGGGAAKRQSQDRQARARGLADDARARHDAAGLQGVQDRPMLLRACDEEHSDSGPCG